MRKSYLQEISVLQVLALLLTNVSQVSILLLTLISCSNSDNFPKDYVGFKTNNRTIICDQNQKEQEIELEIIAGHKENYDRTVALTTSSSSLLQLTENKATLKSKQKSIKIRIKIFPKQMVLQQQYVHITCTPQWKDGEISKISLLLKQK